MALSAMAMAPKRKQTIICSGQKERNDLNTAAKNVSSPLDGLRVLPSRLNRLDIGLAKVT